jgi:methenyltetrahydrofolate cyclohydrolase
MDKLIDHRLGDFLGALAAPTPTPGGGSAAAAAAAMGASLLAMVAALPKTRTGGQAEREALDGVLPQLAAARARLAELVDADTVSYDAVTAAYKLPKGTDEEKARRSGAIQAALRGATDVPLEVMRASEAAARQGVAVARFGNRSASSDATVGFELLRAGLRGAALNVRVNLGGLRDAAFAVAAADETRRLEAAIDEAVNEATRLLE